MEPMTLGSHSNSPASNVNYLPSFLMGDQSPTSPRNTLSPNKVGRNISYVTSPNNANTPQDFNRSNLMPKSLMNSYASPTPPTPLQNHNTSISGPPTQGLFDSLHNQPSKILTPTRYFEEYKSPLQTITPYNESYVSNNSFNGVSRNIISPLTTPTHGLNSYSRQGNFWVTVFGFPPSAASTILQHFTQCGIIQDKVFPSQNGNWVHIKYSSRLECDKALNFNEKIIGNLMIGVTNCHDRSIMNKENSNEIRTMSNRVRPLTQSSHNYTQNEDSVIASPKLPQRSTGLVNKAMDLLFGW